MTDRPASTASLPAASFLTLLRLPESRFAASEVMGLLETDPIRQAFGLEPETVAALRDLVRDGGIRWGADGGHAGRIVGHTMDDSVTWRRGLDRMLMGYAMGRAEPGSTALVEAGDLGVLRPMEAVEGDLAPAVGALCRFFDAVSQLAAQFGAPCTVAEWEERLQSAIDTFYRSTNENYREIAMLRRAVRRYAATARAGGESEHSFDVVAAFIESQFQSASGQGNPAHNAVLFSSLGTMRPTPRPILCLLGVNDGAFPRPDDRPTFDLMARRRHRGDRSARLDDRLAFLEAIMCARQRLHISYVGRSDRGDDVFPPSPVVSELRDYLVQAFALPENARDKELLFCETRHHLQAFHPDYFTPGSGLFSYSSGNLEPARRLAARAPGQPLPSPAGGPATVPPPPDQRPVVRLADLQRFFRNPAEAFFRQALRFRLEDSGSDALADTEMFAADSLASYNRETLVLDHLLAGGDPARLPDLLREAALIPLGAPGAVEAASLTGALRAYLDADCEAADCTVYELLARHRAARPQLATCELQQAAVSGDLGFLDDDGGRRLVFARYSETKPKDLLSAWLAHLLGTLASETPVSTLVLGQSQDKPQCRVMARLPRDKARETLGALIGRHLEGQSRLLPFAPHTSHDYVKALLAARKKGKPDEAATRAAVEAARKRWLGLKEFRGEIQDPHLRAAWGERGPVEHARFGEHAEAVWGPLLEAIDAGIRAAPGTAGEGAS
jgi:exodeoxyribonuclease V gamma subunit